MKKIVICVFTCLCLSLIHLSSLAGNRPGAATLILAGGNEYFAAKRHIKDTSIGLVGLGWDFTREWGVQGIVGFFNTKFKHAIPDDKQINGTLFSFDAVYHYPLNDMFEPYVLAGVGILGMNPNRDGANNQGNINAGVGVQWFVHKMIAFQVEARDFYTILGGKNDVMLDGGINFLIDFC